LIITNQIPKKNTVRNYRLILNKFSDAYGQLPVSSLTQNDVLNFLSEINKGTVQNTKIHRFRILNSFFNFIIGLSGFQFDNPCQAPLVKKMFKGEQLIQWHILDKDIVDEVIFRTLNKRDRIILELMARAGMRINEVLNIKSQNIEGRKIKLLNPKSGKESETVYIPQKLSNRIQDYILDNHIAPEDKVFPITYGAARSMVKKAGDMVDMKIRPHDLRRFAATYASRRGTPIEIVSKVILRHSNLATTQRYLGRVSDIEAIRWVEQLHG